VAIKNKANFLEISDMEFSRDEPVTHHTFSRNGVILRGVSSGKIIQANMSSFGC
jgi:hypothetical protein